MVAGGGRITLLSMDDPEKMYIVYYFDYLSVLMQSPRAAKDTHYGIWWKQFMYKIPPPKKLRDQKV